MIDAISFMLRRYLTLWELNHLKALAKEVEFIIGPDNPNYYPASLGKELRRLRELGLIELKSEKTIVEMCHTPGTINVNDYVRIPERGKRFLTLRETMINVSSGI